MLVNMFLTSQLTAPSAPRQHDQFSLVPPTKVSSLNSMPPPTIIPAGPRASPRSSLFGDNRVDVNAPKAPRGSTRGAGFKPIGQASSAIKRFFPGDDDEDEEREPEARSPLESRLGVSRRRSFESTSPAELHIKTHLRRETYPPPQPERTLSSRHNGTRNHVEHEGSERHKHDAWSPVHGPQRHSAPEDEALAMRAGRQLAMSTSQTNSVDDGTPAPPTPSTSSRNELYKIINQVGEGTFGKVYKAQNTVTGVYVALKRIRMESERDGFPFTAMREIKLLQSLRHDNIVRLYEMMVSNGQLLAATIFKTCD
jgi:CTD kinase subunit alpha